jgi:hypothetical protein
MGLRFQQTGPVIRTAAILFAQLIQSHCRRWRHREFDCGAEPTSERKDLLDPIGE